MATNLRYADDTTLLAATKEDLLELVERVRRASEKAGLHLNVGKTKVMTTGDIGEVTVDGKDIEVVTKFVLSHIWILVYIVTRMWTWSHLENHKMCTLV